MDQRLGVGMQYHVLIDKARQGPFDTTIIVPRSALNPLVLMDLVVRDGTIGQHVVLSDALQIPHLGMRFPPSAAQMCKELED